VPIHFASFRSRILVFVAGLLVLVQSAGLLAVQAANLREARRSIDEALELTAAAFQRSLEERRKILVEKALLLSADFAFKTAMATGDHDTILSALENHRARVGADLMLLLELSGETIADTRPAALAGTASELGPLLSRAREDEFGEASSIRSLGGAAYQLVTVPLFMPEPRAWIVIGFALGDTFARELQQQTRTQVSLLLRRPDGWNAFCSTLDEPEREALEARLSGSWREAPELATLVLDGQEYVAWTAPLDDEGSGLVAVLQRSLEEALASSRRLRAQLLAIFALGLLLSLAGSALVATRVTRPVADLARAARRIRAGNYGEPVAVEQRDEIGALAASFNDMMKGLTERDQVRDLLGRVVAPEIARELLSKEIELGGEERTVTVFFCDVRGFTGIAEREPPERLVRMLNTILTGASAAIEARGGVVEEYMGDGVKALFGAPLEHEDDARRAVLAALDLVAALPQLDREIAVLGGSPLAIGIGINTARVVAGRMGSLSRLKYTVVGDGVNLASRLEGLTRRYGVGIVVSESTVASCPDLAFRELDRVRVKGRSASVAIFEPLGVAERLDPERREQARRHQAALERFRARDWDAAEAGFAELARREPGSLLYALYRERIATLRAEPPGPDWDGTISYDEK
jgi:adenylate cyclase